MQGGIMKLINILIVCLLLSFTSQALARNKTKCKSSCRFERAILIKQCINEEREYWDNNNITKKELNRNCRFLTYDNYLECYDDCMYPQRKAVKFYDEHVEGFPDTKGGG